MSPKTTIKSDSVNAAVESGPYNQITPLLSCDCQLPLYLIIGVVILFELGHTM